MTWIWRGDSRSKHVTHSRFKNQSPPDIPDIMSALLAPVHNRKPSQEDMNLLIGDSQLIIVAGGWVFHDIVPKRLKNKG